MKYCKDCKHFSTYMTMIHSVKNCTRPGVDPVLGPDTLGISADYERLSEYKGRCGPDAVHFEPLEAKANAR